MKTVKVLAKLFLSTAMFVGALPLLASGIVSTPVGTPGWEPADIHLFSAPIGTPQSGFAEFFETLTGILPPPNHVLDSGIFKPGSPHPGPYDREIGNGLANLGLVDKAAFTENEFSQGNGIFLAFMLVPLPGAPVGSSPDFAGGPVIPNGLFPLSSIASTYRNGMLFSTPSEFDTQPLDNVDGFSHSPDFYADSLEFASASGAVAPGSYEYRVVLSDSNGNGWHITAPFEIASEPVPEPIAMLLVGVGFVALFSYRAYILYNSGMRLKS